MTPPKLPLRHWQPYEDRMLAVYAKRYTAAEIAYRFKRTEDAIYNRARRLGIRLQKRGAAHPMQKYSDDTAREALRLFFHEGKTIRAIAAELGIRFGIVGAWTGGVERPHLRREVMGRIKTDAEG